MSKNEVETIEKTNTETRYMPLYRVILHNDDVNTMIHVMMVLSEVFNFEHEKCIQIMEEAHNTGSAHCKTEPLEHAELHRDQLQAFSLIATIEPE